MIYRIREWVQKNDKILLRIRRFANLIVLASFMWVAAVLYNAGMTSESITVLIAISIYVIMNRLESS